MASSFVVSRAQIIYALCLPLAALMGFLLADPLESSSIIAVFLVLGMLLIPLLLKAHHVLLLLSCNTVASFTFLPGSPPLWLALALAGFIFTIMGRCIDPERRLMVGGTVPWALLTLGLVVCLTAMANGGVGLHAFGSANQGGRYYFFIMAAILGYFVLASHTIPTKRASLYVGLFFLSSATSLLTGVASIVGGKAAMFLYMLGFSPDQPMDGASPLVSAVTRVSWMTGVANGGCLFLLARYGLRGILDLDKPWRLIAFLALMAGGLLGGFRSFSASMLLLCVVMFFVEGLHHTRYLLAAGLMFLLCAGLLAGFSTHLPISVQRAISFLPVEISPVAKIDADASMDWRIRIWKSLAAEVPRHLLIGKGYHFDPNDLYMAIYGDWRDQGQWAMLSGDYHNGPLSVVIPFGIWGVLAFGWFLVAGGRLLYHNYAHGNPDLLQANQILFGFFVAKIISFVVVFGAFYVDLIIFTAVVAISVAINNCQTAEELTAEKEMDLDNNRENTLKEESFV